MKTRKLYLLAISAILALLPLLSSCGATHAYWGVENDYEYAPSGYYHAPPKHKKVHKKHKPKPKPPKHKKHKKHHDD